MFRKISQSFGRKPKFTASPVPRSDEGSSHQPACERLEARQMFSVSVQEFAVPTPSAGLQGITTGLDGNYYFAEQAVQKLGRLTPSGTITEYPLLGNGGPALVGTGPDGNIYVPQTDGISIFSPRRQRTTKFINTGTDVTNVVSGADGSVWFTEQSAGRIGRLNVTTQAITLFDVPSGSGSQPYVICRDTEGAFWFSEQNGNKIGHVVLHKGVRKVVEFDVPTSNSMPAGIVQGPDGSIWFAENASDKLGKVNPNTGLITEFTLPTSGAHPLDVTPGKDGNIYFSENISGLIGSITPSGTIVEESLPSAFSGPVFFAPGAGRSLFLTEHAGNNIAAISY